jgi:hypothetical protein
VTALVRMRLSGYVRTGRFLPPLISCLVVLGTLYGGGAAQAGEAYGVSAIVLFPVLAWQTKLLLDAEPDVQRRLARVAVGGAGREIASGLVAALLVAVPVVAIALVLPWVVGGVRGPEHPGEMSLASGITIGLWAHVMVVPPALGLGAWASRAVTHTFGKGAAVLLSGAVFAIVLGVRDSPAWWLAPPLLRTARLAEHGFAALTLAGLSAQVAVWSAIVLGGYTYLRRRWS